MHRVPVWANLLQAGAGFIVVAAAVCTTRKIPLLVRRRTHTHYKTTTQADQRRNNLGLKYNLTIVCLLVRLGISHSSCECRQRWST